MVPAGQNSAAASPQLASGPAAAAETGLPQPEPRLPQADSTTKPGQATPPQRPEHLLGGAEAAKPAQLPPTRSEPNEPHPDPEDWSNELARLDLELRRLGWNRDQEGEYLQRAFGHPSRSRLTSYGDLSGYLTALEGLAAGATAATAPVPLRRRDLLAQCDELLERLGWNGEQGRAFLESQLGAASRQQLSDIHLLQFNMLLESELLGAQA